MSPANSARNWLSSSRFCLASNKMTDDCGRNVAEQHQVICPSQLAREGFRDPDEEHLSEESSFPALYQGNVKDPFWYSLSTPPLGQRPYSQMTDVSQSPIPYHQHILGTRKELMGLIR
jgi:hypothetical protein